MAKKKTAQSNKISWIIVIIVLVGLFAAAAAKISISKHSSTLLPAIAQKKIVPFDFGNQKLFLDEEQLTFVNGSYKSLDSETDMHNSTIGNKFVNPSGNRAAAILVDNPGGSGTFYYLVGAMSENGRETYSEPVLLGDRIKIESVSVDDPEAHDSGMIIVEYLDRSANSPMSDEPTQKKTTKYAFQDNVNLIHVLQ